MAEISTQTVVDAITRGLRQIRPESIILDDEAAQGITPGAFIVSQISAGQDWLTGSRRRRTQMFDVTYFSDNSAEECRRVADDLFMALETVTTGGGDLLHGSGMEWRMEDYVLHFLVSYQYNLRQETEKDPMETLTIQEG